jgi:hypothetical protein
LSGRDAAPVCLGGRVLGAARHPWIWALSKLALFTAGGNSMLRDSAGQQAGAWMQGVSSLSKLLGELNAVFAQPLSPALPRLRPPRLHTERVLGHHHRVGEPTAALRAAELQILQRAIAFSGIGSQSNRCQLTAMRSSRGDRQSSSRRMMACRSVAPWWWQALHQTELA